MASQQRPDIPAELYTRKISELLLTKRVRNIIERSGIGSIGALLEETPEALLKRPGFGKTSYLEVRLKLIGANIFDQAMIQPFLQCPNLANENGGLSLWRLLNSYVPIRTHTEADMLMTNESLGSRLGEEITSLLAEANVTHRQAVLAADLMRALCETAIEFAKTH